MFQDYVTLVYLGLKSFLFFTVVTSLAKFDPLRQQIAFLSLLYTGLVAFLSWVFLIAPGDVVFWHDWRQWQIWLAQTFVLMFVYLKLLSRFDEGALFWALILGGFLVSRF